MPVTSSSVPPKGRRISICSSDSGKTTHSRPRALTSDPTAKLILASLICSNTATPHPEGDRMLPDRQGDRHTPPRGRPQGSQPRINPTPALTKTATPPRGALPFLLPPKYIRILGNFACPILLVSKTNHNVTPIFQAHCIRGITLASFRIIMIMPIDINRDHV